MNLFSPKMKTLLLVSVLVMATPVLFAAAADKGDGKDQPVPPENPSRDLELERELVKEAKRVGKAGNVAAVEEAVSTLNLAKKNTAEWHTETAQRLIQTAEELAREGDAQKVEALVKRALQQLKQAEQKAKDPAVRAAALTLEGFIHERYLADNDAAIASYEAAAQAAPAEGKEAGKAAERLKRTEENRKRKDGGRG